MQTFRESTIPAERPRRWYTKRGETLQLDLRSGT